MELNRIQVLLDKYFEGKSTIEEEDSLRTYFDGENIASTLEQYKPIFDYYAAAKTTKLRLYKPKLPTLKSKKRTSTWISVAASVAVIIASGTYTFLQYNNSDSAKDLGTYDDPEVAFRETQKALAVLSNHVNSGIEGMQYMQEFEKSKNKIFNPLIKN